MHEGACIFCDIVHGRLPALVVYEEKESVAFLDRRPLFPGHILLVPREHAATLIDLPERSVEPLFLAARFLAAAVEKAMEAEGTFVAMNNRVSQSVPHLHIHIVPRRRHDGLKGFFWPRHRYADDAAAEQVRSRLQVTILRMLQEKEQP